jgi:hypothetical protein
MVGISIVGGGALLVGGAVGAFTKSPKKAMWGALVGAAVALFAPIPFDSNNPIDRLVVRTGYVPMTSLV